MGQGLHKQAQELLTQGLRSVRYGRHLEARDSFRKSAESFASAEALTYWAWMEHQLGNTNLAMELCQNAIQLDPDFGNPYNDLGSYLISQGRLDDAIPWLKRAIESKRYDARHYPHINLAQIFMLKNFPKKAIRELVAALEIVPGDVHLREKLDSLRLSIN